jgi:hypothetical protein
VLQTADGARRTRETENREELLAWLEQHQRAGDLVVEVGTTAKGPAVRNMLAALRFGAHRELLKRADALDEAGDDR